MYALKLVRVFTRNEMETFVNYAFLVVVFLSFHLLDIAAILATQCIILVWMAVMAAIILRDNPPLRAEVLSVGMKSLAPAGLQIAANLAASAEQLMTGMRSIFGMRTADDAVSNVVIEEHNGVLTAVVPYRFRGKQYVLYTPYDNAADRDLRTFAVSADSRRQLVLHPGVGPRPTAAMLGVNEIVVETAEMETF